VIRNFFVRQPLLWVSSAGVEPLERAPALRVLQPERVQVGPHLVGGIGPEGSESAVRDVRSRDGGAASASSFRMPSSCGSLRPSEEGAQQAAADRRGAGRRAAPGRRSRRDRARWRGCGLRVGRQRPGRLRPQVARLDQRPDRGADQLRRRLREEDGRGAQALVGRQALPESRSRSCGTPPPDLSTSAATTPGGAAGLRCARDLRVPDRRAARPPSGQRSRATRPPSSRSTWRPASAASRGRSSAPSVRRDRGASRRSCRP
jgi:hypothetical protein